MSEELKGEQDEDMRNEENIQKTISNKKYEATVIRRYRGSEMIVMGDRTHKNTRGGGKLIDKNGEMPLIKIHER